MPPRTKKADSFTPAGPSKVPVEDVLEAATQAAEDYAKANPGTVADIVDMKAADRAIGARIDGINPIDKAILTGEHGTPPEPSPESPPLTSQDATADAQADSLDVPPPESPTEAAGAVPEDAAKSTEAEELAESRQIDPETVEAAARPIPPEVAAASEPEDSEELLSLREWSRQVESMNADIIELTDEHEEDKKRAKASKARLEAAQSDLNQFIAKGQESHPLFDKPKPKTAPASTPAASTSTLSPAPARPAEDEAWKSVQLSTLGFTPGVFAKLQEAGIETVGKLAAWSNAGKLLIDIPGIGEAKAQEIDNVMDVFYERRALEQAKAEAQAKAPVEPVEAPAVEPAEAQAEPVAPEAPAEPAKPKRKRKPKGEAVEETPSETRSVADQLDAQAEAAEALDGPDEIIEIEFDASGIMITGQDDVTTEESDLIDFDDSEPEDRQLYE